jgi:hypothetical protein
MTALGLSDAQALALAVALTLVAYAWLVVLVVRRERRRRARAWHAYFHRGGLIADLVKRWRGPRLLSDRREQP